ncbi:MAG: hypothetical protein CMQ38_05780 [Gammaproteobacteria bacterium]|nr:hypothetical protein [Gammaproteobacteria bacterium]
MNSLLTPFVSGFSALGGSGAPDPSQSASNYNEVRSGNIDVGGLAVNNPGESDNLFKWAGLGVLGIGVLAYVFKR